MIKFKNILAMAAVAITVVTCGVKVEAADIHTEDSMENPIVLQDGSGDSMELSATNTVDYFKFTVDKKRTIGFNFHSLEILGLSGASYNYSIKNGNMTEIKSGTIARSASDRIEMILTPGDYYIVISKVSDGIYTVSWNSGVTVTQAISLYTNNSDIVELGKPISLAVVSDTDGSIDKNCKWTVNNKAVLGETTEEETGFSAMTKSCGTVTITATLISDESVKASKTFTVVPPKTKISKATNSKSKQMKVTCKKLELIKSLKDYKYGYQVQYSKDKNFTKATTKKIKKGNTITLNKLKKKTYYVRVRTYAKGSDGKTYYSAWSDVKKVKIKK